MKQKSFVAFFAALVLCFGLSTAAFAIDDDISAVTYTNFEDVDVSVVFKTVNPSTKAETAISGETVGANTDTSVLEMLIIAKNDVTYKASQFSVSYDPAYVAVTTVGEEMAVTASGASVIPNNATGTGRNVLIVGTSSSSELRCASGDSLLKVYFDPRQNIPVTELKDHIALVNLNSMKSTTEYGVSSCRTYVTNSGTATQYMMAFTYFPSSVTAKYSGEALDENASVDDIKAAISLEETYGVDGVAVTEFDLYSDDTYTTPLAKGDLTVGSNTLYVKTDFGGKTSVTVTAKETVGKELQEALDATEPDGTYKLDKDQILEGAELVLTDGKMLDLNGHTLKVDSLSLTGDAVIGGEGKFYGTLNTAAYTEVTKFGTNGGWMPIKDEEGYYTFADVSGTSIEAKEEKWTGGDEHPGQTAGVFTLTPFFRKEMGTLVNDDNEYQFTISITFETTAESVGFRQVDKTGQTVGKSDEKNVKGEKVTFELELNEAIKAALEEKKGVESVFALWKKNSDIEISNATYQITMRNNLFAKTSGVYTLAKAGYNWDANQD